MVNTKHDTFVKKLKSSLESDSKAQTINSLDDLFEDDDEDVCSEEIMKELEKKIDELFGPIDDD